MDSFFYVCIILSLIFTTATASIDLVQPLQSQLPLIARVNQSYSWTFIPPFNASNSNSSALSYSISGQPSWLVFSASSLMFSGTPSSADIGNPQVTLSASDGQDTAFDTVKLCVTPYPAPLVNLTAASQFHAGNPSLASVFAVSPSSALAPSSGLPALRIPPGWSFSIGFAGDTFTVGDSQQLFYYAPNLPDWVSFDHNALTFDGVTPHWADNSTTPFTMTLYASDQEGYRGTAQPFEVIVSAHELSQNASIPPLNITTGQAFHQDIRAADLSGVVYDNKTLFNLQNLSASFDNSAPGCSWVSSVNNFTLTGTAPNANGNDNGSNSCTLPLALTNSYINQTLRTNFTLRVVSSVFTSSELPTAVLAPGSSVSIDLASYFVPGTNLSLYNITLDTSAVPWLSYNPEKHTLGGKAPEGGDSKNSLQVKITAHRLAGSASDTYLATLPIIVGNPSSASSSTSSAGKTRTILIASFTSVISAGIVVGILACCRHRVAARNREDGMYVIDQRGERFWREKGALDNGLEYTAAADRGSGSGSAGSRISEKAFEDVYLTPRPANPMFGFGGLAAASSGFGAGGSGVSAFSGRLRKVDFIERIKNSLKRRNGRGMRPVISRPVRIVSAVSGASVDSEQEQVRIVGLGVAAAGSRDEVSTQRFSPQGSFEDSSRSSSSTELAIAHERATRRPDFGPPREPRERFVPQPSSSKTTATSTKLDPTSADKRISTDSAITYDYTVARASQVSVNHNQAEGRPRLVEFNKAKSAASSGGGISPRKLSQKAVFAASASASGGGSQTQVRGVNGRKPVPLNPSGRSRSTSPTKSPGLVQTMRVRPNEPFSWAPPFAIPPSHPNLRAFLEDGGELPKWIQFERKEGEFWGIWYPENSRAPSSSKTGGMADNQITVVVKAGAAEVGRFAVLVDE